MKGEIKKFEVSQRYVYGEIKNFEVSQRYVNEGRNKKKTLCFFSK